MISGEAAGSKQQGQIEGVLPKSRLLFKKNSTETLGYLIKHCSHHDGRAKRASRSSLTYAANLGEAGASQSSAAPGQGADRFFFLCVRRWRTAATGRTGTSRSRPRGFLKMMFLLFFDDIKSERELVEVIRVATRLPLVLGLLLGREGASSQRAIESTIAWARKCL